MPKKRKCGSSLRGQGSLFFVRRRVVARKDSDGNNAGRPYRGSTAPKRSSNYTGSGQQKVEFRGYVNVTLNDTDKAGFKGFIGREGHYEGCLATLIQGGYKVSISFDKYHDCFSGNLYCQLPDHANAGYCLAIKGGDPFTALARAVFVHYEVLNEVWRSEREQTAYNEDTW